MSQGELPAKVRKLIDEQITSVEQLEVLLLLRAQPGTTFTAAKVSEEIRTSSRSAEARLQDLARRGFLRTRRDGDKTVFWYEPESSDLRAIVDQLAEAYLERRYTVIDLIFSKPIVNLRLYADAFRFRKDPSDG